MMGREMSRDGKCPKSDSNLDPHGHAIQGLLAPAAHPWLRTIQPLIVGNGYHSKK